MSAAEYRRWVSLSIILKKESVIYAVQTSLSTVEPTDRNSVIPHA